MASVSVALAPVLTVSKDAEFVDEKIGSKLFQSLKDSKEPCPFYKKKMSQEMKPCLSGKPGDLIDFSDGDDDDDVGISTQTIRSDLNARMLLSSAKSGNCSQPTRSSKSDAPSNALTNFKTEMQKKMKLQREEGMNKREEMYRKEFKDFNENFGSDDLDVEDEAETCSNVSDESAENLDVQSEKDDDSNCVRLEEEPIGESLDTQNLNLVLDDDSEKLNPTSEEEVPKDDKNFNDSSTIELVGSLIAPYQRNGGVRRLMDDTRTTISNVSNLFTFPPDDTQELEEPGRFDVSNKFLSSPSSNYHYSDEFNSSSTPKLDNIKSSARKNLLDNDNDSFVSQDLLGLCSGQFAGVSSKATAETYGTFEGRSDRVSTPIANLELCQNGVLNELHMDKNVTSQEAEDEILQLLTYPFVKSKDDLVDEDVSHSERRVLFDSPNCHAEEALDGFIDDEEICPTNVKRRVKLFVVDDEEDARDVECKTPEENYDENEEEELVDEEEGEEDESDVPDSNQLESDVDEEDDEVAMFRKTETSTFQDVKGKIRKEFIDNEAELSGSEIGSEDEDEGSENDFLEAEEGDLDHDLPDDDELRNQVGRIHNKQMLDDDKRRLILYKEAYLPDGELHSENDLAGRRLRWRTNNELDVDFAEELKNDDKNEDDDAAHCSHRDDDQRVMFLFDKKQNFENLDETDSDMFLPSLTSAKITIRRSISTTTSSSTTSQFEKEKSFGVVDIFSENFESTSRRDSFLTRSKNVLSKIVKENGDSNSALGMNMAKSLFTTVRSPPVEQARRKKPTIMNDCAVKRQRLSVEETNSVFEFL